MIFGKRLNAKHYKKSQSYAGQSGQGELASMSEKLSPCCFSVFPASKNQEVFK